MVVVYLTSGPSLRDPLHTQCRAQDSSYSASEDEATPLEQLYLDMRCDEQTVRELAAGRRVGFYKVRSEIGCGIFSCVKLGVHSLTKDKVAIKILDKTRLDPQNQQLLWREVASMERLWLPNIARLYEVEETPSHLHLVMELAPGGELQRRISTEGRLSDPHSKVVFSQIVAAVKHMHDNDIVHLDLKAENIFLSSSGLVKVGDFGFSICSHRDELLDTFCGSPPYAAPERWALDQMLGCEWLLPVEMPRRPASPRPDALHLLVVEPHELSSEEAKAWAALQELGVTAEHIHSSQGCGSRSAITGPYRILQHRILQHRMHAACTGSDMAKFRQSSCS